MAVAFKVEAAFGGSYADSHLIHHNEVAVPEPSSSDATNWFGNTGGGAYSIDYPTTGLPPMVKTAQRRTWTTAATGSAGGGGVWALDPWAGDPVQGYPARTLRARLWIRSSTDNVFQPYFQAYTADQSTKLGEVNLPLVSCKAWQWVEIVTPPLTCPANTGSVRILAYQAAATVDGITGHTLTVGEHLTMTAGHVEDASTFAGYQGDRDVYGPGPAASGWTDISDYVTGFGTDRGRNDAFDAIEAGTLNLTLDNADGRFTPQRAASPYYPNVKPMTPLRVTASLDNFATDYPVFTGVVEKWPVKLDNLSTCDVTAVDLFGVLGRSKLRAPMRRRWQDAGCTRLFPLNADSGFSDVIASGKDAVKFGGSSGTAPITYDGTAFYRGDGYGTGMTVTPSVSTAGAGLEFSDNTLHGATMLFMWQPDSRLTVSAGDTQCLLNIKNPGPPSPNGVDFWLGSLLMELNVKWNGTAYAATWSGTAGSAGLAWNYLDSGVVLTPGKSYLFAVSWAEQYSPATGDYLGYYCNIYDTVTGANIGMTGTELYGTKYPADKTAQTFRVGGKFNGSAMYTGQLANVGLFANGFNADVPSLLLGTGSYPVSGMPSEADQTNEVLRQAGYDYLATNSWPNVALAPLDWQDRKSVLEVVQSCGFDADGLMFPTAEGRLGYMPGPQRQRSLRFKLPTLTDKDDFEPGIGLYVDDQNIVNDVTLEFAGGGGLDPATSNAVSPDSVALYETATMSASVNLIDETKRRDLAAWIAYTRGQGGIRIESVTFPLTTATDPDTLLGLEIGSRIGLAFPDTAPFTSGTFFIEGISLDTSIDGGTPDSSITFRLSFIKPQGAWVLEDSTWGVLDDTTRPYC